MVELPLKVSQTAALLEVVHSAIGLVRSPVMITGARPARARWAANWRRASGDWVSTCLGQPFAAYLPGRLCPRAASLHQTLTARPIPLRPVRRRAAMQVASRIWVLWGIINPEPVLAAGGAVHLAQPLPGVSLPGVPAEVGGMPLALNLATLLTAWSITEVVRYSFFAVKVCCGWRGVGWGGMGWGGVGWGFVVL